MPYSSPAYNFYVTGTYSGSTFTATSGGGGGGVQYSVEETQDVSQILPGDPVQIDYSQNGSVFADSPGYTYIGYYSPDGGGSQYALIQNGDTYLLVGQSDRRAYNIAASPYTKGNVCFCTGSRIRVMRNGLGVDIPVEDLVVGDLAITASGAHRPIRWIGHRQIDLHRHPDPREARPVRIRAHAFGENRPCRDLAVSPAHAICIDVAGEVLIPARALVNGVTIVQDVVDSVTYWHVELDGHDILLAENLPAESYIDMGNRGFFVENGVVELGASPDGRDPALRTYADYCRPVHESGPLLALVRERLQAQAVAISRVASDTDSLAA